MNRRLIGLITSIVLATVGTAALVAYVRSAEDRALADERLVEVLVVSERIESGTKATDVGGAVRAQQVPSKVRAAGAVDDLDDLGELVAEVDLLPGEQVVKSRFVEPRVVQRGDVPAGKHELTVPLDAARALGGRIIPGDTVGVVASFESDGAEEVSHLIFHKVLVTAVQREAGEPSDADETDDEKPQGNLFVSFAVDASTAEQLVFAAEFGKIWLTSEPTDAPEAGTEIQTVEKVLS